VPSLFSAGLERAAKLAAGAGQGRAAALAELGIGVVIEAAVGAIHGTKTHQLWPNDNCTEFTTYRRAELRPFAAIAA
jgi:hypothetical protein